MVTQCGQPESRVAGSGATETGGWRPRPALPPTLPAEPGHENARSSRKRRNETQPKTEQEIPKKWATTIPWKNREAISKEVETEPKTTSRADPREGDGWKATDEAARAKAQAPRLKQGTVQASRTGQPRTSTATTKPVEGSEAPRNHSSEAGATQERAQAQAQRHASIPGWQQVLHKEDTERQHECDRPTGHATDGIVNQGPHPRAQASRARRRTEIDDPTTL